MATEKGSILVFRHWPVIYMVLAALVIFLCGSWVLIARALAGTLDVTSSILGIVVGIPAVVGVLCILWEMAWAQTTLRMTPTHLKATSWLRLEQLDVPWNEIRRVRRLPKRWWARGGEAEFGLIETLGGQEIRFMPHLMRDYTRFIEELKIRAKNLRECS
jgi:hypothetical protein